ncbi:FAD-dependent monooxygenase, partial [Pseudomonas fluorescens]
MSSAPTASTLDLSTDIAIVGAGPVGLMIANYLGQCGVNVTLVEKLDSLI